MRNFRFDRKYLAATVLSCPCFLHCWGYSHLGGWGKRLPLLAVSEYSTVPELLTNPAHWHLRAREARRLAQQLDDPEARAAKLEMADKYERLAARATEWINKTEDIPQFLKSAPPTEF